MRLRTVSLAVVFLSLLMVAVSAAPFVVPESLVYDVTFDEHRQDSPRVSYPWVIYTDYRAGNADLWAKNLMTNETAQITNDSADEHLLDVFGGVVFFQTGASAEKEFHLYDLATRERVDIRFEKPADAIQFQGIALAMPFLLFHTFGGEFRFRTFAFDIRTRELEEIDELRNVSLFHWARHLSSEYPYLLTERGVFNLDTRTFDEIKIQYPAGIVEGKAYVWISDWQSYGRYDLRKRTLEKAPLPRCDYVPQVVGSLMLCNWQNGGPIYELNTGLQLQTNTQGGHIYTDGTWLVWVSKRNAANWPLSREERNDIVVASINEIVAYEKAARLKETQTAQATFPPPTTSPSPTGAASLPSTSMPVRPAPRNDRGSGGTTWIWFALSAVGLGVLLFHYRQVALDNQKTVQLQQTNLVEKESQLRYHSEALSEKRTELKSAWHQVDNLRAEAARLAKRNSELEELHARERAVRQQALHARRERRARFKQPNPETENQRVGLQVFKLRNGTECYGTAEQIARWQKVQQLMDTNFEEINPYKFEHFIADLLTRMGYKTRVTPATGDFGADVIAEKGRQRVLVEVKKFGIRQRISPALVQRALGALTHHRAHKAIFVTTSDFSNKARQVRGRIEFWNGDKLRRLVREWFIEREAKKVVAA
jgi:restriction endonuclease Mrr